MFEGVWLGTCSIPMQSTFNRVELDLLPNNEQVHFWGQCTLTLDTTNHERQIKVKHFKQKHIFRKILGAYNVANRTSVDKCGEKAAQAVFRSTEAWEL